MNLNQLHYYKEKTGYTFEQLAKLSGVPQGTIQKIFTGETKRPRRETMQALEAVLCPDVSNRADWDDESAGWEKDYYTAGAVRESSTAYHVRKDGYTLDDYYALPDERRVELLNGVIYDMAAPSTVHQYIITKFVTAFDNYITGKKGGCMVFASPVDVQIDCDDRTMLQPDVVVICRRSKIINRCIMGAPDFVLEILSKSSRKMDLKLKMAKYAQAGVREYWVVDPDGEKTYVFWTDEEDLIRVYGPDEDVPVGIFENELTIPMKRLFEIVRELKGEDGQVPDGDGDESDRS